MSNAELVGLALAYERNKAGKRQQDVAAAMDVSQSMVSRFEAGKSSMTAMQLIGYAMACDITLVELTGTVQQFLFGFRGQS